MSMTPFGSPGVAQKQNDALQIPLCWDLHVGRNGIDSNLSKPRWESINGTQVEHLNSLSKLLKYSTWRLAWEWAVPTVRARVERFYRESPSLFLRR
jgi:hypothetical protein